MVARHPTSSTIMENSPEGCGSNSASTADGLYEAMNGLKIDVCDSPDRKKSLHSPNLSIQPTPYFSAPQPGIDHSSLGISSNERAYLLENLKRQHERGERLSHALSNVELKLAAAHSKGGARKLRKEASLLKGKIYESQNQEQLIMLRLNDLRNEHLSRAGPLQAQQPSALTYPTAWGPYSPLHPWGQFTPPVMMPLPPISPLTPLPPGIYQSSPMIPSPLESPLWLGAQYPVYVSVMPYANGYTFDHNTHEPYAPEQFISSASAPPAARRLSTARRRQSVTAPQTKGTKSVDSALAREGAYNGRRWSLADAFSPTPKDKRMSMPGLQTIWRDKDKAEE